MFSSQNILFTEISLILHQITGNLLLFQLLAFFNPFFHVITEHFTKFHIDLLIVKLLNLVIICRHSTLSDLLVQIRIS
jgi:hypothetical protein